MDPNYVEQYVTLEQEHWWFRARRVILRTLMARDCPGTGANILEIGVGPGENLYALYPDDATLTGLEPDAVAAEVAAAKGPIPVFTGTIEALPEPIASSTYDRITLFDVIEHIEDDDAAIQLLLPRLRDGGQLVLSVPAFQWLWGKHDVINHHYRRYSRRQLTELLHRHGLEIQRATYFNTLLSPPVVLTRVARRLLPGPDAEATSDFTQPSPWLNGLLYTIFRLEASLLGFMNLPFGVSALVVARKPA